MGKAPSNMVLVGGVWHWRLTVPVRLRDRLGRRELRRSLGTGYLREARPVASLLTSKTKLFWESFVIDDLNTKFASALRAKQDEWLTEFENECLSRPVKHHHVNRDQDIEILRDMHNQISQHINEGDYREAKEPLQDMLQIMGIDISEDSLEYKRMAYCVLLMMKETNEIFQKKRIYNFLYRPESIGRPMINAEASSAKVLSELIEEYFAYRRGKGELVNETTYINAKNIYAGIVRILGDLLVSKIDFTVMDGFVATARKLKKGWNNNANKGKDIALFIAEDIDEGLSHGTINNWISGYITPLFKYAVRMGYMDKNYSEGLTIKNTTCFDSKRVVFTDEQLFLLFHSKEYEGDLFEDAWMFWIPILGYATGARIEELCQLTRGDLVNYDGISAISINNENGKTIKNASSKRFVPLHNVICDLGFENYVQRFDIDDRIFPTLLNVRNKYSHEVSKWFGDYTVSIGLRENKDGSAVFHSFRHGIVTYSVEQDLREDLRKMFTGHKSKSVDDRYKHINILHLKKNFVDKIILPVTLAHLKSSKWCR